MDIYDRVCKQLEVGTALYEKLILLDGAIIALSITYLGSLSSRTHQISQVFQGLAAALKTEGEAAIKKMDDFITEGKKNYHEGTFAKLAVRFAILGILLLCVFTIISLRILF